MVTEAAYSGVAIPPGSIPGVAKEIATPCQILYKSGRFRIFRWVAGLTKGVPAHIRDLFAKVLAWRTQDMAAGENADTLEFPCIPDHQLVRRIGKGAYGEVWLARSVLGTYRGVKIVRRTTFEDDRPFDREFEGIQRFEPISRSHPGFVSILHVGRNDVARCFYYVMEVADDVVQQQQINPETYVARTLSEEVKRRGRLPVAECVQIGISLSAAVFPGPTAL